MIGFYRRIAHFLHSEVIICRGFNSQVQPSEFGLRIKEYLMRYSYTPMFFVVDDLV